MAVLDADAERGDVMTQCQRVIQAPFLEERAREDHRIDDDRERSPRQREARGKTRHRPRQLETRSAVAFARCRDEAPPGEEPPLENEQRQREREQNHGEHRCAARILLHADDGEIDRGREYLEVPAKQQRIAEVRKTFDEDEQERVRDAGRHQRQRNGRERCERRRAERLRRFFKRRAHTLGYADQHEIRHWRQRERLREPHPRHSVDPTRGAPSESPFEHRVDRARAPEQQDQRKANDERRRDHRQHRQNR